MKKRTLLVGLLAVALMVFATACPSQPAPTPTPTKPAAVPTKPPAVVVTPAVITPVAVTATPSPTPTRAPAAVVTPAAVSPTAVMTATPLRTSTPAPTPTPTVPAAATTTGAVQRPVIPHTLEGRSACTGCHAVGGPGVGVTGGVGTPADHQGRTDATCLGCHKPSP